MYLVIIIPFVAFIAVVIFLIIVQMRFFKKDDSFSATAQKKDTAEQPVTSGPPSRQPRPTSTTLPGSTRSGNPSPYGNVPGAGFKRTTSGPLAAKPSLTPGNMPGTSFTSSTTHIPGNSFSSSAIQKYGNSANIEQKPPGSPANQPSVSGFADPNRHASGSLEELIQEYERGMQTDFDDQLGAILFVTKHVVMMTPQEVTLAFQVCTNQIYGVLRPRRLRRAALLTDIAGLVIGRDVTSVWGQTLKNCFDDICIKVDQDTYLVAHYNSKMSRPSQEQLQEKIRRIQIMTAAAINNFQSNIFDTREEAVAFLLRMKEYYKIQ
jgi:hypothetical protein